MKVSNHSPVRFRTRRGALQGQESRSARRFRKGCRSRFPSHAAVTVRDRQRARTCFEGPFGEVIRTTGPMAKANPFRFSTKYQDDETDLLYYGYRFYNASTGRWLNRDPLGQRGGRNLYGFVGNNPLTRIDRSGLDVIELPIAPPTSPPQLPPSRFPTATTPELPRFRPQPQLPGTKCCPKASGSAALGLGVAFYFASTQTLNGGEDEILAYMKWLGELQDKCKKFPKNLDDCLDSCDADGLLGQALKDCYCKCWKAFPPTARQKSRDKLIEEWEKTHPGQQWPNDPEFPDLPQIPHHLWPLGDGGPDDGGTNIEPLPRRDHINTHKDDRSRWGRRNDRKCD